MHGEIIIMATSEIYIIISIIVLAVVAVLIFVLGKGKKLKGGKLSPLAGLALGLIVSGIVFGDERFVGYGLMGAGVAVAVIDMVLKMKATGKSGKNGK
jgi:hypothetical protein